MIKLAKINAFNPFFTLAVSTGLAVLFALFISVRYSGETRFFYLYYMVPIAVPFVAYIFDRLEYKSRTRWPQWSLDGIIVVVALVRNFVAIPFVSGHVLFLTYSLFSSRTLVARGTALVVLVVVVLMKYLNWGDVSTPAGGFVIGLVAALFYRWSGK